MSVLSRVISAVTSTTESRGRPLAADGRKTFPGIAARSVFDVMTTARTVANRLVLYSSDCTTNTGLRFAGRLPMGGPRSAQQMLPRWITSRPASAATLLPGAEVDHRPTR